MSTIRVYQRKFKNRELGRQIEKLPEVHGYWIPETPAKTKPARLQKVYTKRCLKGNLGKSSLAQISEVEARGRASPDKNNEEKGHKSQCSSDDLIDLNKSISDWEDVVIAPGGSKDSGYSGEPACFVVNSSGCSGEEGDFSCREALSSLSDIKACTNNVARHLDFGTSGESNEGLYEWNAPLNSTTSAGFLNCPSVAPPFQESETATTQGEASQESSNAPIKDAIGWITVSSFKVSASRIDRNTVELSTENFLPESHNLLHNLDVDNDTSNTGSHVTRCGQDKVSQEVECLEPATPLLKHNINKRPRNVTDVNQRPLKRSKNRKHRHRPKIAGQGRSKRTVKNSPVKNKEKRNYVVKKEKKNHVRKTESMKKGETSTQQTSTTEYCTNIVVANSSLLSVVKQPNDDNMMEIVKPNMGVLEVAVTGCQSSDDKVRLPTVSIVSELAASHASDMKSTMQSNVGSFGGQKLLNDLDLQVNSFRWSIHGTRSARDYCRNPYVRNQTGFQFQHRPSWVHQMPFKVNHCLSNIRKVEPNFPKRSRRRRIKRQRKSIVSISGFLRFHGCIKKKRSRRFIPRANLSSLAIIQICTRPLKVFKRKSSVTHKGGLVNKIIEKFKKLKISDISAIVPHQGSDSAKKPKPKIVLDPETVRRWNQLMKIDDDAGEEKVDEEKEKKWEEERKIFRGRVDSFNSRMHLVLGDRRFKPWKGSVVDSVVGVFLTQNVSDFLSSSAYMSLAAKCPVQSTSNKEASADDLENKNSQESTRSNVLYTGETQVSHGNQYFVTDPEHETPVDMVEGTSLVDIEDIGNTILPQEYCRHESEVQRYENPGNASSGMESLNPRSNSKSSEAEVGMKGNLHTQSELNEIQLNILNLVKSIRSALKRAANKTRKTTGGKKENDKEKEVEKRDWDSLRRIYSRPRARNQTDSVDWEAVRQAPLTEIAEVIKGRGQQTIIAKRIQDFLNRVYEYHGSIDLEWLRYAPQDLVKEYLLEIPGLGLKSVECVRLLALKNIAFPVDINVARISVRLGWIPLEPLPGDLQFHLLEEYPVMDSIQQYLWPRLCELDQKTLYELHYHMITFGKVVCTKKNPNCGACPMKAECRHLASAIASANLSLPGPSKKVEERYMVPKVPLGNSNLVGNSVVVNPISVSLLESNKTLESEVRTQNCEPIIEEPKSPLHEQQIEDIVSEDIIDDEEEIPTIQLNNETFKENLYYFMDKYGPNFQTGSSSRALVPVSVTVDSIPIRKLKQTSRLRTEHQVYEIPDNHELLRGLEKRECGDSLPYLLAIWTAVMLCVR
ncbi:DEMETER-like protein 2 isoform X2 [Hevea brasiliensis]|uniref:DEMETER-like protein 2 isoform X2 n=1 Tax=Hevea brasiliensis TaxID=3981 RepID=UPI0025F2D7CC|nr:DEMETER-like protein 2 isoform X2 [Hevea brasiliensis]